MKKIVWSFLLVVSVGLFLVGCNEPQQTSNQREAQDQETITGEIVAKVGMPSIKNGREKKLLKAIFELRDQSDYVTYTYMENMQPAIIHGKTALGGKLTYFGQSIGYPIPYATQYTAPSRPARAYETHEEGNITVPQADPNGLYSPASADATWVLLKDPNSKNVVPVYSEPKLVTLPYKLPFD